jgi:hypothetical protein
VSISGITEFAVDRIFQRVGTARTITFGGTYAVLPSGIDIRLYASDGTTVLQDWTAATLLTAAAGAWTASLSVPQGGWYRWQARPTGDTPGASAVSTRSFAVGALILCIGQSNMRRMWGTRSSPPAPDALTRRWAGFGWFATDLVEQTGESTALHGTSFGGNGGVRLGNLLRAGLGVPVGMLQLAIGSTAIDTWQAAGSSWLNVVANLTSDSGTDFEVALWHQGESDVIAGTTEAGYAAQLQNVIAQARSLSGRPSLPFGVAIVGCVTGGTAGYDAIRRAQRNVATTTAGVFIAGSTLDTTLTDGTHWDTASYERVARRYAQSVLAALGAASVGAAGPRITGARRVRGTAVVTVDIQQAGGTVLREVDNTTDGGALTGFVVLRNGVPLTISSTAFVGNAVELTLSAAPNGGALTVTYQAGGEPVVTAPVYDDAPPQSDTRGTPLQPSYSPFSVVHTGEVFGTMAGVTFLASFVLPAASATGDRWLLRVDDGSDNNVLGVVVPTGSANIIPRQIVAGVVTDAAAAGAVTANVLFRVTLVISATHILVSVDGVEGVSMAHTLTPAQFRLGGNFAGDAQIFGECGGLRQLSFAVADNLAPVLSRSQPP